MQPLTRPEGEPKSGAIFVQFILFPFLSVGMCFETFQTSLEKYVPELPFNLVLEFGEYRELLQKLEKGRVDLVVTPQNIEIRNVIYHPFSRENIILAAGDATDTSVFEAPVKIGEREKLLKMACRSKMMRHCRRQRTSAPLLVAQFQSSTGFQAQPYRPQHPFDHPQPHERPGARRDTGLPLPEPDCGRHHQGALQAI
jgi:hypothetical protein